MEVELPDSYRQFLLTHNGGCASPSEFKVVENGNVVWMRIHFFHGVDDDIEGCDLLWNCETLRGRLPAGVYSVACDEGGNLFCLDLRANKYGPVLFRDHELEHRGFRKALSAVVAATFEDWIAELCDRGD
jgi:hypothetical protein